MASHTERLWLHSLAAELYRLTGGHVDPAHRLLMGSPDEGRKMCLWLTVISRKWPCPPLAGSSFDLPATIIACFLSYNFAHRVSLWGSPKCKVFSVCEISRFAPRRFGFLLHLGGIVSVQHGSQHLHLPNQNMFCVSLFCVYVDRACFYNFCSSVRQKNLCSVVRGKIKRIIMYGIVFYHIVYYRIVFSYHIVSCPDYQSLADS